MNLSATSLEFKKLITWLGLALLALFCLWLLWLFLVFAFRLIFPAPPAGPDLAFGKLPQPFVFSTSSLQNSFFDLDIPGSEISSFPKVVKVYPIAQPVGRLESLDSAKSKARNAGLSSEPIRLSENQWKWTDTNNPNRTLILDIVTNNFTYSYDWIADTTALTGTFKTTDEASRARARDFLSNFSALKNDLKSSPTKITYYKLIGGQRNQVGSYSEANAVQVQISRKSIADQNAKYLIVEAKPLVSVLFSPSSRADRRLLEINYTFWAISFSKPGTYSSVSGQQAFENLKAGKALVVEGADEVFEQITIGKVTKAYLNPSEYQPYLQPVYVFEGEGLVKGQEKQFQAFVPAIILE